MKGGDLKRTLIIIGQHVESKVLWVRGLGPREVVDAWDERLQGVTQQMT